MRRFAAFEALGVRIAAISDLADGDCAPRTGGETGAGAFLERVGAPAGSLVTVRQVHSNTVHVVDSGAPAEPPRTGDALLTGSAGLALGIVVADCVPVYLLAADVSAIGLVHAGREGVRQGVVEAAARRLMHAFGGSARCMHALIGPSAGPCCYEVSAAMAAEFARAGYPVRGRNLDLWHANRQQLEAAGVPPAHIDTANVCTICSGRYHSLRAGGGRARNLAVLMR
ncbi:MAG: polyphenol oxidase family protein [Candidatus Hydrogenedentota bacterium]